MAGLGCGLAALLWAAFGDAVRARRAPLRAAAPIAVPVR
jgi:hypothetical protein